MSIDKNHSEAFERYLKGQMSPEEAHSFEREVLDDPFATEALEGFENQGDAALEDIQPLKQQVLRKKNRSFTWMKIAASIALIMAASWVMYVSLDQVTPEQELAMEKESPEAATQPLTVDTITSISNDDEEIFIEDEVAEDDQALIAETNEDVKKDAERVDRAEEIVEETASSLIAEEPMKLETKQAEMVLAEVPQEVELVDTNTSNQLQGVVSGVQIENEGFNDSVALRVAQTNAVPTKSRMAQEENDLDQSTIAIRGASALAEKRSMNAENMTISGKVSDDDGEALPGVNVLIKGTTTGTQTDLDGNYMLPKMSNMTLIFSNVGFENQEVQVGTQSTIDVTMGGAEALQEVVVTGYGAADQSSSYQSARPSDGNKNYKEYLEQNLQYPESALTNDIEGTVILQLTISPSGDVTNIEIKKSLGFGCDQEAIRLIKDGPKWRAAERGNQSVEDNVRVKVKFKLDD